MLISYVSVMFLSLLLMSANILLLDFFNDTMSCIRPSTSKTGECENYISSVCWIQGLYIYHDAHGDIDNYHAYGMPRDPKKDGMTPTHHHLCEVGAKPELENVDCKPLNRMYFTQYQYMPFYIASLAIYYYLPYLFYRVANGDVISLGEDIMMTSDDSGTIEKGACHVVNTYFKYAQNGGVLGLR